MATTTTTAKPLVKLESGRVANWTDHLSYFARCAGCGARTPLVVWAADDLAVLAGAKRYGWRCDRQADGTFRLTCEACVGKGR